MRRCKPVPPAVVPVTQERAAPVPDSGVVRVRNPLFAPVAPTAPDGSVVRVRNPLFRRYIPVQAAQRAQEAMYDAVMTARENGIHLSLSDDSELTLDSSFSADVSMSSSFDELSDHGGTRTFTSDGGLTLPPHSCSPQRRHRHHQHSKYATVVGRSSDTMLACAAAVAACSSTSGDLSKIASAEDISGRYGGGKCAGGLSSSDESRLGKLASVGSISKNLEVSKDGRYHRRKIRPRRNSLLRSSSLLHGLQSREMYVCVCVCMCVGGRECGCGCGCGWERERECVCVRMYVPCTYCVEYIRPSSVLCIVDHTFPL
jgi:hypothetical protein